MTEPPLLLGSRRRPTLPHGDRAVPSALEGLTTVFEMGTGVTPPPLPPETRMTIAHGRIWLVQMHVVATGIVVKPHGQLVPVSFTHCCASTPGLSTSSSSRGL
jgi:hypothetical protein